MICRVSFQKKISRCIPIQSSIPILAKNFALSMTSCMLKQELNQSFSFSNGFICNHNIDGGQSLEAFANCAQIDVCFSNILNCERALDAMALKYVNGDSSVGTTGFFILGGM